MQFVRKSFLVIAASLLPALLFATAFDIGVLHVVGNAASVKKILASSGIYNSIVSSALDQANNSSDKNNNLNLTDPAIKAAAESTFDPTFVQNTTEKVIDGTYDWLNGKTTQPNFNIDLNTVKATFAIKVGDAAAARAATLPACPANSLPPSSDPFSAACLPKGITARQVVIRQETTF